MRMRLAYAIRMDTGHPWRSKARYRMCGTYGYNWLYEFIFVKLSTSLVAGVVHAWVAQNVTLLLFGR